MPIFDFSYSTNAKRLSHMIRSKPMAPEKRFIKYTEFAAEFGNDNNLDLPGRYMNFIEFYCLDIIVPFFLLLGFLLYSFYIIVRKMTKMCKKKSDKID